ncbi:hypothetical protein C6V06_19530 [Burkholderia gladioli]|nr:hypothetical protein EDD84_36135 [Burkholderia gladioli]NBI44033.1 hypothetical protein [Burkholderia sp. ISTR5]NIF90584.1 hypothetical protein [Burkholderia sp. Cy-637]MBA1362583.1 hypothetical protein [Burkholderia gladioli]POS06863.1 hypothetical protein C3Y08_15885 [Burkholderia gladioli]
MGSCLVDSVSCGSIAAVSFDAARRTVVRALPGWKNAKVSTSTSIGIDVNKGSHSCWGICRRWICA